MTYQNYRRSIRLKEHDYTEPGYYHVIIKTYQRQPFFGMLHDGTVHLNQVGQIAQETWLALPGRFSCVALDLHVIMPDHLHGIVIMKEQDMTPLIIPTSIRCLNVSECTGGRKNSKSYRMESSRCLRSFAPSRLLPHIMLIAREVCLNSAGSAVTLSVLAGQILAIYPAGGNIF